MTIKTDKDAVATISGKLGQRSLVLVGLMGAGKSAIGRKVATRLNMPFVDADAEIEKAAKQTVADIFANYGEEEFRRLEERVIARLLTEGPQVLATGGGAYMNADTRAAIRAGGVSLWLSADIDLLMARVSKKATRPLLQKPNPRGIMQELIDARYPIYAQADMTVQSRDVTKDEMATLVINAIAAHLSAQPSAESH